MKKSKFPLPKVYQLLGSGPAVLITSSLKGKNNIMPIAWTTPLDFDPPLIACCIGDQSYTFEIVKRTKEFAINIPTAELVKKVYACGQVSGRSVNKFEKVGFTPEPASKIEAPLIRECYANLECKVVNSSMVGTHNLFIVKVVAARTKKGIKHPETIHHITGKRFVLGGKEITA